MPLNLQALKDDLYVAFTLGEDINPDSEETLLNQIDAISIAIDAYIRSGTVNTTVNTAVVTAVAGAVPLVPPTLPAGAGSGTGTGIGNIT